MTSSTLHDQELEKQDQDTSKLEKIEQQLEARRGSMSSLLDDAPEFEAFRLRPVQRQKNDVTPKKDSGELENLKLKKVDRPVTRSESRERDPSDNESDTSSSSGRLEEIERRLAERRGSQPLLDEPPEFESLTLRKVKPAERENKEADSQVPFEASSLRHVDPNSVPRENGVEESGELFDKLRMRQSKSGAIDESVYQPPDREPREDLPPTDPDKPVLMAYTGAKIPSRAFSRLQKSISFDNELEEKTMPVQVARRVRQRRRQQLQQAEDETTQATPSDAAAAANSDKMYVGDKIPSRYFNKLRRSVDRDTGSQADNTFYLSHRRMSEPVNRPEEMEYGYESDTAVCRGMYSGQRIPSRSFTRLRRSVERDTPAGHVASPGRRRRRQRERPPEPEAEAEVDSSVVDQVIENMYVGSHIPSKYFQMLRKSVDKMYQDDGTEIPDEGTTEF